MRSGRRTDVSTSVTVLYTCCCLHVAELHTVAWVSAGRGAVLQSVAGAWDKHKKRKTKKDEERRTRRRNMPVDREEEE